MSEPIAELLVELERQPTFEKAAHVLLSRMTATLRRAVEDSGWSDDAALLRCMIHLRPDFGYQGLVHVELDGMAPSSPAHLSSMTAWRALCERRCGLMVDVEPRRFAFTDGTVWEASDLTRSGSPAFATTHQVLHERDVTHLLALPLLLAGAVRGMVTFELRCADAVGDSQFEPWTRSAALLEQMARLGGLFLDRLPRDGAARPARSGPFPHVGPASAGMLDLLEGFARLDAPLLLVGESGTGKSRLAAWVHERSGRAGDFIKADVASLTPELAAVRLFGSQPGAYTGATNQTGCIHKARGGTLFIDEIARLSLDSQVQLFRLLDDGQFRRLGATREESADIRIVAATNEDLPLAARERRFRGDLLSRIENFVVEVPPLRKRPEEIEAWAHHFLLEHHKKNARNHHVQLSPEAALLLRHQRWPGNLRDLKGVVEKAWVMACLRSSPGVERWPTEVHVTEDDVRAAQRSPLARGTEAALVPLMQEAARVFVLDAERLRREGRGWLRFEQADSFRGAVVAAAVAQLGDPAAAAKLLGLEAQLPGSNHLVTFRDWFGRFAELAQHVGGEQPELPAALAPRKGRAARE